MAILSIFKILLSKYTGQNDIIIGIAIAGRLHSDLESVIGMFVNMLPVRSYVEGAATYIQYLEAIREIMTQAYGNQEYPYEMITEKIKVNHPIFRVGSVIESIDVKSLNIKGLKFDICPYENETSHFDLQLIVSDLGDEKELRFEYRSSLFKKSTIERMAQDYIEVLQQILANPNIVLNNITLQNPVSVQEPVSEQNPVTLQNPVSLQNPVRPEEIIDSSEDVDFNF